MKKLLLLFLPFVSFTQVIKVQVDETHLYTHSGNWDSHQVMSTPEWDTIVKSDGNYVIDIDNQVSKFYKNGVLVSKLKFQMYDEINGSHYITLLDYDLNNPNDWFRTRIIVNPEKNSFVFYWYDDVWNLTKVESATKPIIKVDK